MLKNRLSVYTPPSPAALEPSVHLPLARNLRDYLRWRNANTRRPDVLAVQCSATSPSAAGRPTLASGRKSPKSAPGDLHS